MAPTILVTGAGGLIGTTVVREFAGSSYVLWPLREVAPDMDLLRPGAAYEVVSAMRPDIVLHLAWVASGTQGYRQHPDNALWARSTVELLDACAEAGAWMIGTGSVIELDPEQADAYSRAKAETWQTVMARVERKELTWLRPHYVFDPESGRPALLAEIQRALASGTEPMLTSPNAVHDFIHVRDVAAAIRVAVENDLRGLVPIASGREHSVSEFARAAGALSANRGQHLLLTGPSNPPPWLSPLLENGWHPRWTEEFFHD